MKYGFDENFIWIVYPGVCEISLLQILLPTEQGTDCDEGVS